MDKRRDSSNLVDRNSCFKVVNTAQDEIDSISILGSFADAIDEMIPVVVAFDAEAHRNDESDV